MKKISSILKPKNIDNITIHENDCILDIDTILATLYIFYTGKINSFLMFELFKFCETFVLFDKIYCYPNLLYPVYDKAGNNDDNNLFYFPKLEKINYNILEKFVKDDFINLLDLGNLELQDAINKYPVISQSPTVDLLMGVSSEIQLNCQYIPSITNNNVYYDYIKLRSSLDIYSELAISYNKLSKGLLNDLNILKRKGRIKEILIPPIPALLFSKISKPNEIIDELIELRYKLKGLRNYFTEYKLKISDDSISIKESLRAYKELEAATKEISKHYDIQDVNLITEWKDGVSLLPKEFFTENKEFDYKGISKFFLGKPAEWIVTKIRNRKLGQLFSIKKKFIEIKNYNSLINKLWGKNLDNKEFEELKRLIGSNDNLYKIEAGKS